MNAYELAEQLKHWSGNRDELWNAANMLRQQADRIAELEKDKKELHAIAQRMAMAESDARKSLQSIKDAQTKPLNDEEISEIWEGLFENEDDIVHIHNFARAIEERHGIK